jgi:hypothetical protein
METHGDTLRSRQWNAWSLRSGLLIGMGRVRSVWAAFAVIRMGHVQLLSLRSLASWLSLSMRAPFAPLLSASAAGCVLAVLRLAVWAGQTDAQPVVAVRAIFWCSAVEFDEHVCDVYAILAGYGARVQGCSLSGCGLQCKQCWRAWVSESEGYRAYLRPVRVSLVALVVVAVEPWADGLGVRWLCYLLLRASTGGGAGGEAGAGWLAQAELSPVGPHGP